MNNSPLTNTKARRANLLEQLWKSPSGSHYNHAQTQFVDGIVAKVATSCLEQFPSLPPLSIVATGGYGRQDLAPWSDVDLMLIPLQESGREFDKAIRMVYSGLEQELRENLRLQIGYSYQLIHDAPGLEHTMRSALLDARLVAGSSLPLERFLESLWESFPTGEFVLAKIQEREVQMRKSHTTPLVVEPDLKIGAGGLRSYHFANWIRVVIGEKETKPNRAVERVMMMRNLLQATAESPANLLTRSKQGEIAERLGIDMFEMMSDLASAMEELHEMEFDALRRLREARYSLTESVVAIRGEVRISGAPPLSEAALGVALAAQLGLSVEALEATTSGEIDSGQAMFALSFGAPTLRTLDRCKILGQLLPELQACRTLMPRDSSHTYTVYEHTLRLIEILDTFPSQSSFFAELHDRVRNKSDLYMAALLHDVGKADLSQPHSITGAEMAKTVCARWGLSMHATETIVWLVREHLTMAQFVRVRDLQNPDTIREFAAIVESPERLDLLTLLTAADIQAVSVNAWTPSQQSGLRELHSMTWALLEEGEVAPLEPAVFRQRVLRAAKSTDIDPESLKSFLATLPAHYVFAATPEQVHAHYAFAQNAKNGNESIEFYHDHEHQSTEITVCCKDRPGLLSTLLGTLYAHDMSLAAVRAATTNEEDQPIAIDVFSVSLSGRTLPPNVCAQVADSLRRVLRGELSIEILLASRGKDSAQHQQVLTYEFIEGDPAILEVRVPRGRGMAYRLSRFISASGWNIQTARLGQWAGHGVAAFYITRPDARPIRTNEVTEAMRHTGIVSNGL
ncbi:MAG: HD domain-containing protein [Armatimonadetes bacterium]|nr:HD domain-containing protein [Armatimonadota bacterium]